MNEVGVKQFLHAFTGSWFTKMSGPFTVPFAVASLLVPQAWLKAVFGATAIACGIGASYAVWRKERVQLLLERENAARELAAERARNGKPDIRIRIEDVLWQRSSVENHGLTDRDRWHNLYIAPTVHFVNSNPPDATIAKVFLEIRTATEVFRAQLASQAGPLDAAGLRLVDPKNASEMESDLLLRCGIGKTRFIRFLTRERGSKDLEQSATLKLTAIDSLGTAYAAEWPPT